MIVDLKAQAASCEGSLGRTRIHEPGIREEKARPPHHPPACRLPTLSLTGGFVRLCHAFLYPGTAGSGLVYESLTHRQESLRT